MQRFASLLYGELVRSGHEAHLVKPPVLLGRLCSGESGLGKWIGYIDRFLLYLPILRRQLNWADVVHLCDQTSAVYIPHLRDKPHVVTCHDVLAIRVALGDVPGEKTRLTGRVYQRWILKNLRKANEAICVSHQTESELRQITGLSSDRTFVIANALNYLYKPLGKTEAFARLAAFRLSESAPFFLHVGGNQWYKNRRGVVRIYSELIKRSAFKSHRLIMVGKAWPTDLRELIAELGLNTRVLELVDISNERLCALYSTAEALLFPSLQEGFGWPIVEAQSCGCPVVTTDRRPMTEVAGTSAIFIDPSNPSEAATKIGAALIDRSLWREDGLKNATRFSCKDMTASYLECYRKVIAHREKRSDLTT